MTNYGRPVILIAEDHPEDLKTIISILTESEHEFSILTACNRKLACEISLKEIPDLILMNWEMPEKNGLDALMEIKKNDRLKYTPIIIITGVSTTLGNLKKALDSGASDFICKPFNKIELLARIYTQLRYGGMLKQIFEHNALINQNERQLSSAVTLAERNTINTEEETPLSSALKVKKIYSVHKNLLKDMIDLKHELALSEPKGKILFNQIINTVKKFADENLWDDYELKFLSVRPRFFEELRNEFPHLTPNDLRLCSLFSLNLESKEIARILNITPDSIKVTRKRLRKKLNLTIRDNLFTFLARYN
jgi:DNA-binding response OmpR family regulator/DNA-binding CsgD family transcriptional regulator